MSEMERTTVPHLTTINRRLWPTTCQPMHRVNGRSTFAPCHSSLASGRTAVVGCEATAITQRANLPYAQHELSAPAAIRRCPTFRNGRVAAPWPPTTGFRRACHCGKIDAFAATAIPERGKGPVREESSSNLRDRSRRRISPCPTSGAVSVTLRHNSGGLAEVHGAQCGPS